MTSNKQGKGIELKDKILLAIIEHENTEQRNVGVGCNFETYILPNKYSSLINKIMEAIRNPQDVVHSNVKYVTAFIPCPEDDERCVGSFTSNDGRSLCHVREIEIPEPEEIDKTLLP